MLNLIRRESSKEADEDPLALLKTVIPEEKLREKDMVRRAAAFSCSDLN